MTKANWRLSQLPNIIPYNITAKTKLDRNVHKPGMCYYPQVFLVPKCEMCKLTSREDQKIRLYSALGFFV